MVWHSPNDILMRLSQGRQTGLTRPVVQRQRGRLCLALRQALPVGAAMRRAHREISHDARITHLQRFHSMTNIQTEEE
jgi:hypothetical protein